MECKACGVWYVSGDKSGVCPTCKRTLKNMGIDLPYDRLRELVEADRDGRCVVLPCRKDVKLQIDGLEYQADHWNTTLSLFAKDNETRSGYKVKSLSIKEIKAVLKRDQHENP